MTIFRLPIWLNFNVTEFSNIKNEIGTNGFVVSFSMWIKRTNAIGIRSSVGRYGGGTFAHKDIAFEFATWISPEFKLYLIKEFQRLKLEENERLILGWDAKRALTKINYRIHTDSIKENIESRFLEPACGDGNFLDLWCCLLRVLKMQQRKFIL